MVRTNKCRSMRCELGTRCRRIANIELIYGIGLNCFNLYLFLWRHLLTNSVLFIKGSTSVCGQNVTFFCKTKIALSTSVVVWFGLTDDFPWDGWVQTRVLACPDVFRKFSRFALLPVSERLHVIVVACFEFGLAQTKVVHGFAATFYAGFVDNTFLTASTGHRALCLISAVTRQSFGFPIRFMK